jgi:hypothetical protein
MDKTRVLRQKRRLKLNGAKNPRNVCGLNLSKKQPCLAGEIL